MLEFGYNKLKGEAKMTDKLYWETMRYIKKHGITIEELAKAVGYSRCHFSFVLNGGFNSPRLEKRLSDFLKSHKNGSK